MMNNKIMLLVAIAGGAAIVAIGFLFLKTGTSGPCAPVSLTAKVGYTLVGLPTLPIALFAGTVGGMDTAIRFLENTWGLAAFDAVAYTALIFLAMLAVRGIRRSRTKGQHAAAG